MYKKLCILAFACFPCISFAGIECLESVASVIAHQNGNFYFQSSLGCQGWCQINWGSAEKNKGAYAMLLTAKASGKKMIFGWPALSSCSAAKNVIYSSPDYMYLVD